MKRNAIIRIVIWSIVIVLLAGIMGTTISAKVYRTHHRVESIAEEANVTAPASSMENIHDTASENIREIEIEWVAGSITIEEADVDHVTVKETMASDPKYTMVCKSSKDKLSIKFCEEKLVKRGFGISLGEDISKNLIIRVPRGFQLDSLEVEAAFANMIVKNLTIREVEFDGASGTCDFENCTVDKLDLDTASGDVSFSGNLKQLDIDAASASVCAALKNVPSRIDMDSMSGDLELTLPEDAGFTLSLDAMSSDFITDFEYRQQNSSYVSGDGSCRISMDAMSGDVYIHKAK